MRLETYEGLRDFIKPGDVIAFQGKGLYSKLISFVTQSKITHVGIVVHGQLLGADFKPQPGYVVHIVEALVKGGVQMRRLSDVIRDYNGDIWLYKLSPRVRADINLSRLHNFLLKAAARAQYDMAGIVDYAVKKIPLLKYLRPIRNQTNQWFCSELIATALYTAREHSEVVNIPDRNISPAELLDLPLFSIPLRLKDE